jgi:hypothetical protein
VYKSPLPVPILSQINPVHAPHLTSLKLHLNIILPFMSGSFKWSLSLGFPYQTPAYTPLFPIRATDPPILFLQSASGECNMSSAKQRYRRIHYFLCNTSSLLPTLSQINPTHPVSSYFLLCGLIQHYCICLGVPRGPCPSVSFPRSSKGPLSFRQVS